MEITNVILTVAGKRPRANQMTRRMAFYNPDGTPVVVNPPAAVSPTAAATVAKTVPTDEPSANSVVPLRFTAGNSAAAPTVSFNGGPARAILLGGTAPVATEIVVAANGVVMCWFDGTNLHQFGAVT